MERASDRFPGYDVETDFKKRLEILEGRVQRAFENRYSIGLISMYIYGNLEEQPGFTPNGVWVEDPHLYPYLLQFAFQRIGFEGRKLEDEVRSCLKHELQHYIPLAGLPNANVKLGGLFYKANLLPSLVAFQPEIAYSEKVPIDVEIDLTTNVDWLSPSDKADLRQLLDNLRRHL